MKCDMIFVWEMEKQSEKMRHIGAVKEKKGRNTKHEVIE